VHPIKHRHGMPRPFGRSWAKGSVFIVVMKTLVQLARATQRPIGWLGWAAARSEDEELSTAEDSKYSATLSCHNSLRIIVV
jgi:hypothetical protein